MHEGGESHLRNRIFWRVGRGRRRSSEFVLINYHVDDCKRHLIGAAGVAFQFRMFVYNDFGVMLFTFFFFSLAMTGYGYFIRFS